MAELVNQYTLGERAEQYVIALRKQFGIIPEARPVDVRGFLKGLRKSEGIHVVEKELRSSSPEALGSIRHDPDYRRFGGRGAYVIRLRKMSPARERFVLAHEIGHLVLHREDINSLPDDSMAIFNKPLNSDNPADRIETQANAFAAELTMPRDVMGELWGSRLDDSIREVRVIAGLLGVTEAMVKFRLHNLGTLSGERLRPMR